MDRKPDFSRLKKVLLRQGEPDVVPFYELFADQPIMRAVVNEPIDSASIVEFYQVLGYDYATVEPFFSYNTLGMTVDDTSGLSKGLRRFVDDMHGVIENRKDFDRYAWPEISNSAAIPLQQTIDCLPEGMKLIPLVGGILENVMFLMGYVPFSYALYEDEQLVWDMFEKIGTDLLKLLRTCMEKTGTSKIGALALGDDMGFKSGTMISPDLLRKFVFPWQKRIVEFYHSLDLPVILHSCGNLDAIMDDLIEYVGIDAKHSYEDKILPVTEAKKRYGRKIAILGGVDVDFLCRAGEPEIRSYVDRVIEECAPGGGYALGTGNSVANYIPVENYLTMLDEGRKKGKYPM